MTLEGFMKEHYGSPSNPETQKLEELMTLLRSMKAQESEIYSVSYKSNS